MAVPSNITILVYSREQRPFSLPNSQRIARPTADYSICIGNEDYRDRIAIERKSSSDLLGCIGQSRLRFERELERLAQIRYAAIVVENDLADLIVIGRSEVHPSAVPVTLAAWSWRYHLPIWFAGD